MDFCEKTIESEYIYKGKILNLRKDKVLVPNGRTSFREIVEHNGGAAIVGVDENKRIALIKQFRKPFEEVIIEIPAGKIEIGEEPLTCAKRELEEETGYKPIDIKLMAETYSSPGFSSEKIYIYLCDKMVKTETNFDADENIETIWVTIDEAVDMIISGKIKDGKTISGILLAKEYL